MPKSLVVIVVFATTAACARNSRSAAPAPPPSATGAVQHGPASVERAAPLAAPATAVLPPALLQWQPVAVTPAEIGELVDLATAKNIVCALYASGLAVCVDVQSHMRTVVFAANPSLELRGPLKLRLADELLCVESAWSVMCRGLDGSAMPDLRVAEVRVPRGEWLLDAVRSQVCTTTNCVSVDPIAPATPTTPMFPAAVRADAGPLRRSAVTAENRWALDQCPTQNDHSCLYCEGSGVCAKWRKAWDIAQTPPKMPRRATCVNGPNQVERCPPTPRAKPIVMSEATKRALIEKSWSNPSAPVRVGQVAALPLLSRRQRLVGNLSAMCIVADEDGFCATTTTPPHAVAWLPAWRNAEPVFLWATRLCALSRRDFRVTCNDLDTASAAAVTVNLPSTTQLHSYGGVIAVSATRLCYSDPRGAVTCLTADANPPVELDAMTLRGLAANPQAASADAPRTSRAVSRASYYGDRYLTLVGPYLCRGDSCQHAVTAARASRRDLPEPSPLVLAPRATQEFAGYERRPTDNGVMACAAPRPRVEAATTLARLAAVSISTVPMGRGGNWRCTGGDDAGFDVDVPPRWSRVLWWGSAACHASGSTVSCLPIREEGRNMHRVNVGFTIYAVDASSELLCASAEATTTPPVCWRLDPNATTFVPQRVTIPVALLVAPPARTNSR